ncbi:hypothetical protein BZG36_01906 [Bifiguratus adelaidae]|uniref:Sm domain-containing protein n=1 Tax=Bifiguratus adelaidae TaxID=1938954 RepID=A0A261Y4H8_9FUNG|nr:hypothetical protein BZG36_01906 [Bifiguratus adelaidae]
MTSTIGVPIKLLHEAQGHIVTLELKNGSLYRGKLFEAEDNMNVQLKEITVTARDGRVSQLDQVYIRGSHVRFFIVPDMLKNAPMFKKVGPGALKGRGIGLGRGRATVARAQARGGRGRGFGGPPMPGRGGFGGRPENGTSQLPPSVHLAKLHAKADVGAKPHGNADGNVEAVVDTTEKLAISNDKADGTDQDMASAASGSSKTKTSRGLDLASEAAFPTLGSGSVKRNAAPMWGNSLASNLRNAPPAASAAPRAPQKAAPGIITEILDLPLAQQLKHPEVGGPGDVARQVMNKTNTDINVSTARRTGTTTFLIKGKAENVQKAKRELLAMMSIKVTINVPIPASLRAFVIGSKGKTLQAIQEKSGARIQMPPKEEGEDKARADDADGDEEEETEEYVDVAVTGDPEGVKIAKAEIENIVGGRTIKQKVRITGWDTQFYPFLAGPHFSAIHALQSETNTTIRVPSIATSQEGTEDGVASESKADTAIVITGEKEGVAKAREVLEERYNEIKRTSRTLSMNIPKRQHRYLVGKSGSAIHELLEKTGCIIELPPSTDPSDAVVIRGPESKVVEALTMVMDKAKAINVETLDLNSTHKGRKTENARELLKFLRKTNKLREIEEATGAQIGAPKVADVDSPAILEFFSKQAEVATKALNQTKELIKSYPPAFFDHVVIDSHLHRHVVGRQGRNRQRIAEQYKVEVIVPEEKDDSDVILLVYTGVTGGSPDKDAEGMAKEAIETAMAELLKTAADASDFITETVNIPSKYHGSIIGPRGTTLNAIIGTGENSASVRFGSSKGSAEKKHLQKEELSEDAILVRGGKEEVKRVVSEIKKLYEETKHQDILNSYTEDVTVPKAYLPHVIGKNGAAIIKLKEELGVKIDVDDSESKQNSAANTKKSKTAEAAKLTIKGIKKNVEAARQRIEAAIETLADHTVVTLRIPSQHHSSLIGAGGKYVRRLEEKYSVRIQFPKVNTGAAEDDNADAVSDKGAQSQASDEVVIKGGKKGVASAKTEIQELLEWEKEHGHVETITFAAEHKRHVVGRGGARINEIKDTTQTQIEVGEPENGEVTTTIQGTKTGVAKAKKEILSIVEEQEAQVVEVLRIEHKYHKQLIGPGGSRLRDIFATVGISDDKSAGRFVTFPKAGGEQPMDEVILRGDRNVVARIKQEIERLVENQRNQVTITLSIPQSEHATLIGYNGQVLKELERKHQVSIQFPKDHGKKLSGEAKNKVTISGRQKNCDECKEEMLAKIPATRHIKVPRRLHRAVVGPKQITYRKLRNELNVVVDHNGESEPKTKAPESASPKKSPLLAGGARIDDDTTSAANGEAKELPFEIVETEYGNEEGDITWVLKGDQKQLEKAEQLIIAKVQELQQFTHTGYLTVPQEFHRHIIGRNGSTISRIRDESGCQINVPKTKADDIVIITGTKDGVTKAKQLIEDAVEGAR